MSRLQVLFEPLSQLMLVSALGPRRRQLVPKLVQRRPVVRDRGARQARGAQLLRQFFGPMFRFESLAGPLLGLGQRVIPFGLGLDQLAAQLVDSPLQLVVRGLRPSGLRFEAFGERPGSVDLGAERGDLDGGLLRAIGGPLQALLQVVERPFGSFRARPLVISLGAKAPSTLLGGPQVSLDRAQLPMEGGHLPLPVFDGVALLFELARSLFVSRRGPTTLGCGRRALPLDLVAEVIEVSSLCDKL